LGGSASIEELVTKVVELGGYSEAVQSAPHTGRRRTKLGYNLAWARTYLKRVGAVENSMRGIWSITEKGERLTPPEVDGIPAIVRQMDSKRKLEKSNTQSDDVANDEELSSLHGEQWKDTLLYLIRQLSPDTFERLAQRMLREAGFIKVEVTGRSGDGGIDGVGVLRVNLLSFQVLFQCKRYQGTVSSSAVRDFRGAMVGRTDKGLMITTGSFSADAKREATRDGAPAIDLIDGELLCDLLKQLKLGVVTKMVEHVDIDTTWFTGV
jgi:restriction system protein